MALSFGAALAVLLLLRRTGRLVELLAPVVSRRDRSVHGNVRSADSAPVFTVQGMPGLRLSMNGEDGRPARPDAVRSLVG